MDNPNTDQPGSSQMESLTTYETSPGQQPLKATLSALGFDNPQLLSANVEKLVKELSVNSNMGVTSDNKPLIESNVRIIYPNQKEYKAIATGGDNEAFDLPSPEPKSHKMYPLESSSHHPCMEYKGNGTLCNARGTYPCEEDHSHTSLNPYYVCGACRVKPVEYDVNAEEEMIKKHRIYLCDQCTETRSNLPALQTWNHPRREPETRLRRVGKCSCYDQLQMGWICEQHRIMKARRIQIWGGEKVKSFRGFFGGDFCASCRIRKPQTHGPKVMWNCAACEDLVIEEEEEEDKERQEDIKMCEN